MERTSKIVNSSHSVNLEMYGYRYKIHKTCYGRILCRTAEYKFVNLVLLKNIEKINFFKTEFVGSFVRLNPRYTSNIETVAAEQF